jgi:Predicted membrane protein
MGMTDDATTRGDASQRAIEKAISIVLRGGVLLSALIVCAGLALLFLSKGEIAKGAGIDAAIAFPKGLSALLAGIEAVDPPSILVLGLLILVVTPIIRVAVSIVAFLASRDWLYAIITASVLILLVAGTLLGAVAP